jgi:hypothetical protein
MLRTVWTQHPRGNGEGRIVNELAYYPFAMVVFLALAKPQGLTEKWMPTIVHHDGLEMMGTM